MTEPNIVNINSIYGKTLGSTLTTTLTTSILSCPTDKVLKINTITAANIDTAGAQVTCYFYDSSANDRYVIASVTIPVDSTLILLGKDAPIYLEEGDRIEAGSLTVDTIDLIISYEQLDDV